MAEDRPQRRLAAILAADVVGYSRLMEQDETGTLVTLKGRRKEVLEPVVGRHRGRVFKIAGDGVLVEFASAVNAVQCAIDLQQEMAAANDETQEDRHIVLRIGINLGDVLIEGSDLYGEGVNIAARLEGFADAGGIVLSGSAYDQVRSKVEAGFEDLGSHTLKNIADPVRVYRVRAGAKPAIARPALALPDKPSIAVLPFTNMSGDPEQEYFADGMVEEITTALSHFRNLFVIARNSSFAYKNQAVDVKRVGRELGVRYVLEGSVRKAGNHVRITAQLIDAASGAHLWADRFEGRLEDVFALQDQVTSRVVGAIAPKLEGAEIARALRKHTESLDAYDHFLRGLAGMDKWTHEGNNEALSHFYHAIRLDPNYGAAYGMAAAAYSQRNAGGWTAGSTNDLVEVQRLANKATELGHDDAVALSTAGFALAEFAGRLEDGDALIERALSLNPNLALIWLDSAWNKTELGHPELALERIAQAQRLSPNDPQRSSFYAATAYAQLAAGHFADAYSSAIAAIRERPGILLYVCIAAVSAVLAGRMFEAQKIVGRILESDPSLRISNMGSLLPSRPEDAAKWIDSLRMAGLPE